MTALISLSPDIQTQLCSYLCEEDLVNLAFTLDRGVLHVLSLSIRSLGVKTIKGMKLLLSIVTRLTHVEIRFGKISSDIFAALSRNPIQSFKHFAPDYDPLLIKALNTPKPTFLIPGTAHTKGGFVFNFSRLFPKLTSLDIATSGIENMTKGMQRTEFDLDVDDSKMTLDFKNRYKACTLLDTFCSRLPRSLTSLQLTLVIESSVPIFNPGLSPSALANLPPSLTRFHYSCFAPKSEEKLPPPPFSWRSLLNACPYMSDLYLHAPFQDNIDGNSCLDIFSPSSSPSVSSGGTNQLPDFKNLQIAQQSNLKFAPENTFLGTYYFLPLPSSITWLELPERFTLPRNLIVLPPRLETYRSTSRTRLHDTLPVTLKQLELHVNMLFDADVASDQLASLELTTLVFVQTEKYRNGQPPQWPAVLNLPKTLVELVLAWPASPPSAIPLKHCQQLERLTVDHIALDVVMELKILPKLKIFTRQPIPVTPANRLQFCPFPFSLEVPVTLTLILEHIDQQLGGMLQARLDWLEPVDGAWAIACPPFAFFEEDVPTHPRLAFHRSEHVVLSCHQVETLKTFRLGTVAGLGSLAFRMERLPPNFEIIDMGKCSLDFDFCFNRLLASDCNVRIITAEGIARPPLFAGRFGFTSGAIPLFEASQWGVQFHLPKLEVLHIPHLYLDYSCLDVLHGAPLRELSFAMKEEWTEEQLQSLQQRFPTLKELHINRDPPPVDSEQSCN